MTDSNSNTARSMDRMPGEFPPRLAVDQRHVLISQDRFAGPCDMVLLTKTEAAKLARAILKAVGEE